MADVRQDGNRIVGRLRIQHDHEPFVGLDVRDAIGRTVLSRRLLGGEVNLFIVTLPAEIKNGMYFICLESEHDVLVTRLLVLR